MKRNKNGTIIFSNDKELKNYVRITVIINELTSFASESPDLWEIVKEENREEVNKLINFLRCK